MIHSLFSDYLFLLWRERGNMIQMILFFKLAYECRDRSDYLFCSLLSDYIILLGQECGNWSVDEVNFFDDLLSKKKFTRGWRSEQSFLDDLLSKCFVHCMIQTGMEAWGRGGIIWFIVCCQTTYFIGAGLWGMRLWESGFKRKNI